MLAADLERLRGRIEHGRRSSSSSDLLLQDLETAYEELRVADEEVRSQQETITRLMESHRGLRLQHERTMAILPVPVVVTDLNGIIRSVNAPAAMLAGVRVARMLGKPLLSLFSPDDRSDLRALVATHAREGHVVRRTATMMPRAGRALTVEVTASAQLPGAAEGEVSWVLLTAADRSERETDRITESLTRLAMLPQHETGPGEIVESALAICRDATTAELSLVVGDPLAPASVASTSSFAQEWDGAQTVAGEGPSVSAHRGGATVTTADAAGDPRWPRLPARLPDGAAGAVAAPIPVGDRAVGVLTAYGAVGQALSAETVELLALTLGGVLHELDLLAELARLEHDMERALASRSVIDQAKGIVMAARGVDAETAWEHLVALSSTQHVKLRELAERIVARAAAGEPGAS